MLLWLVYRAGRHSWLQHAYRVLDAIHLRSTAQHSDREMLVTVQKLKLLSMLMNLLSHHLLASSASAVSDPVIKLMQRMLSGAEHAFTISDESMSAPAIQQQPTIALLPMPAASVSHSAAAPAATTSTGLLAHSPLPVLSTSPAPIPVIPAPSPAPIIVLQPNHSDASGSMPASSNKTVTTNAAAASAASRFLAQIHVYNHHLQCDDVIRCLHADSITRPPEDEHSAEVLRVGFPLLLALWQGRFCFHDCSLPPVAFHYFLVSLTA